MPENDWRSLLTDLKSRPRNRSVAEVDALLTAAGFKASRGKGSHVNYRKEDHPEIVTIRAQRKELPLGYVKAAIRAVEQSEGDEE